MSQIHDTTTPESLLACMRTAQSQQDWNRLIENVVKPQNGGDYPNFWFETIVMSREMDRILGKGRVKLESPDDERFDNKSVPQN